MIINRLCIQLHAFTKQKLVGFRQGIEFIAFGSGEDFPSHVFNTAFYMTLFVTASDVAEAIFEAIINRQFRECRCGLLFGKPYKLSDGNTHVVLDHCLTSTVAVSEDISM